MKNFKNIILLLIFISVTNCSGQSRNILTKSEYNNIKINGINWKIINNTNANTVQMKTLFGDDLIIKTGTEPSLFKAFWNDTKGFYFYFQENDPNLTDDYILYSFNIYNNNSNLTINNKTITIGNNISELGLIQVNNGKEIYFGTNFSSDGITILFDEITKKITSIEYTSFN